MAESLAEADFLNRGKGIKNGTTAIFNAEYPKRKEFAAGIYSGPKTANKELAKFLANIGNEEIIRITITNKLIFFELKAIPIIIKKMTKNNGLTIKGKIL